MKKLTITSILLVTLTISSIFGQSDSVTFSNANWLKRNIAPGLTLLQYHFTDSSLFHSNQHISILKVNPEIISIDIVGDTILRTVSDFAEQYKVLAAINGSFFDMQSTGIPYNSVTYLRIDGDTKAPNKKEGTKRKMYQKGAFSLFRNTPYILKADYFDTWENFIISDDVITSGPLLIIDHQDETLEKITFNTNRHPRTAIGKVSNTQLLFVVVDGRTPQAAGMSLIELRKVMHWLGATDALNLDGGGSSAMYVYSPDPKEQKIVSHPSDNNKFDEKGERKVANVIIMR